MPDCFDIANSIVVLVAAAQRAVAVTDADEQPMPMVDGGSENFNGDVNKLVKRGVAGLESGDDNSYRVF